MMPDAVLVFDLETIPDLSAARKLYGFDGLSDEEASLAWTNLRMQQGGNEFPRLPFHEIVCCSGLGWRDGKLSLFSFSQKTLAEADILRRFLGIFDQLSPTLVSWNGSGFDLPVLMYRAMLHGVTAKGLLDQGESIPNRKYNNYLNRYHPLHTDLMDVLAMFSGGKGQKLDDMAVLMGCPGKQGISGYQVPQMVAEHRWEEIEQYCESDVLNTWLIYLRWLRLKGVLSPADHASQIQLTRHLLQEHPVHSCSFLSQWEQADSSIVITDLTI